MANQPTAKITWISENGLRLKLVAIGGRVVRNAEFSGATLPDTFTKLDEDGDEVEGRVSFDSIKEECSVVYEGVAYRVVEIIKQIQKKPAAKASLRDVSDAEELDALLRNAKRKLGE